MPSLREFIDLLRLATAIMNGDWRTARVLMGKVMHDEAQTETGQSLEQLQSGNAMDLYSPAGQAQARAGIGTWLRSKLPLWAGGVPTDPGASNVDIQAQEREAYQFWIRNGLTPEGAAAKVAAEEAESGFDPTKRGDSGQAGGSFQWHEDRRQKILAATGIDVWTDTNRTDQRTAMLYEMRTGLDRLAGEAYGRIAASSDTHDAVDLDTTLVERPKDREGAVAQRSAIAGRVLRTMATTFGPQAQRRLDDMAIPRPIGVPAVQVQLAGQMLRTANQSPTINQTVTNNITGVSDPNKVGDQVKRALDRSNADIIRNFTPAAY